MPHDCLKWSQITLLQCCSGLTYTATTGRLGFTFHKFCFIEVKGVWLSFVLNIIFGYFLEHLNNVSTRFAGGFKEFCLNIITEVCSVVVVYGSIFVISLQQVRLGGTNVDPAVVLHLSQLRYPELQFPPRLLVIHRIAHDCCPSAPAYWYQSICRDGHYINISHETSLLQRMVQECTVFTCSTSWSCSHISRCPQCPRPPGRPPVSPQSSSLTDNSVRLLSSTPFVLPRSISCSNGALVFVFANKSLI